MEIDTLKLAKELGVDLISINTDKDVCNYAYLFIWHKGRTKTIRLTKSYNKAWIADKVALFLNYSNRNLIGLFKTLGIKGSIYYTSFGFSYDMFFKSRESFNKEVLLLQKSLDDNGIEYTNEYSDANWVYRFKMSQKRENLDRIKHLTS